MQDLKKQTLHNLPYFVVYNLIYHPFAFILGGGCPYRPLWGVTHPPRRFKVLEPPWLSS